MDWKKIVDIFIAGVLLVVLLFLAVIIQNDIIARHISFCDSKYGANNWTDIIDECKAVCSYKCIQRID